MVRPGRSRVAAVLATLVWAAISPSPAGAQPPAGQMVLAQTVTIAPRWFDPAEAEGIITPFIFYYALHDALVKPLPAGPQTPCLADSWSVSPDGVVHEFALRKGVTFHNGDSLTADDVKFSFERYRGVAARLLKERVAAVEVVDPHRVRFRLKQPWPDFMTFYGSPVTGAGWIVPQRYLEKVGDEGFKKAPVKTVIVRSVPDESTRLAMLKRGEADVSYLFRGALAEALKRSPGLTLKPYYLPVPMWLVFAEQWDPKSPWADRRVRLAANLAIDRQAINQAETLSLSKITASIIPQRFDFYWPAPHYAFEPARARQLLAEAGYPNGFDAGPMAAEMTFASIAEAAATYLGQVGIRATIRPLERAALFKEYQDKRLKHVFMAQSAALGNTALKHVFMAQSAALGNTATRLEAFVAAGGPFTYGVYPDIEGLIREQAIELDRGRREKLLLRIQQLMHDKVMFAPIFELASLGGYGPRVAESGLGFIPSMAASAPYEDLKLRDR